MERIKEKKVDIKVMQNPSYLLQYCEMFCKSLRYGMTAHHLSRNRLEAAVPSIFFVSINKIRTYFSDAWDSCILYLMVRYCSIILIFIFNEHKTQVKISCCLEFL